jgi:hypothetical protein
VGVVAAAVGLHRIFLYREFLLRIIQSVLAALVQQQITQMALLAVRLGLIRRQTQPQLLTPMAHWQMVVEQD